MKRIDIAKKFLEKALQELEDGRKEDDEVKIRQSAEKGWAAVVQATGALFERKGLKVPKGTNRKYNVLVKLEDTHRELKKLKLSGDFSTFLHWLHSDCFYDGIYSVKALQRLLRKVREYIEDIEKIRLC